MLTLNPTLRFGPQATVITDRTLHDNEGRRGVSVGLVFSPHFTNSLCNHTRMTLVHDVPSDHRLYCLQECVRGQCIYEQLHGVRVGVGVGVYEHIQMPIPHW